MPTKLVLPTRSPLWKPERPAVLDPRHPLAKGLILFYLMNEGAGKTLYNLVPGAPARVGTLASGVTWGTHRHGETVSFPGTSSNNVTFPNYTFAGGKWSIEFLIRFGSVAGSFVPLVTDTANSYGLYLDTNKFDWGSTGNLYGGTTLVANTYYHFILTHDNSGGAAIHYLNGVQDASGTSGGTFATPLFGAIGGASGIFVNAAISWFRIWDGRILTSTEAQQLYRAPFDMVTTPVERIRTYAILGSFVSSGGSGLTVSGAATVALKATGLTQNAAATAALKATGLSVSAGAAVALKATGLTRSAAATAALKATGLSVAGAATVALKATNLTVSAGASAALKALGLSQAAAATIALKSLNNTTSAAATVALKALSLTKSAAATVALAAGGTSVSAAATIALKALGNTVSAGATAALKAQNLTKSAATSLALVAAGLTKSAAASIALKAANLTVSAGAAVALKATSTVSAAARVALKSLNLGVSAAATVALFVQGTLLGPTLAQFSSSSRYGAAISTSTRYSAKFSRSLSVVQPYSTTDSIATLTLPNGVSISAVTCVVSFPDGTSSSLSLGSGIVSVDATHFKATYATKEPGQNTELWNFTGSDTGVGQFKNVVGAEY